MLFYVLHGFVCLYFSLSVRVLQCCWCWRCTGEVLPVVTNHSDADQSAAADGHRDEESQPVWAAFWKHPGEKNKNKTVLLSKSLMTCWTKHLNQWEMLPEGACGGSVGCRSRLQKSVLQHSIVLLVWALGESCQSHHQSSVNQSNLKLSDNTETDRFKGRVQQSVKTSVRSPNQHLTGFSCCNRFVLFILIIKSFFLSVFIIDQKLKWFFSRPNKPNQVDLFLFIKTILSYVMAETHHLYFHYRLIWPLSSQLTFSSVKCKISKSMTVKGDVWIYFIVWSIKTFDQHVSPFSDILWN